MEAPAERDPPSTIPPSMERGMKTDIQDGKEPSGHDTARTAGVAVAAATFGAAAAVAVNQDSASSGKRALIQYDYEKAEDNELELVEGEYVTNIEMVDDDWWMGTNGKGERRRTSASRGPTRRLFFVCSGSSARRSGRVAIAVVPGVGRLGTATLKPV